MGILLQIFHWRFRDVTYGFIAPNENELVNCVVSMNETDDCDLQYESVQFIHSFILRSQSLFTNCGHRISASQRKIQSDAGALK